MDASLVGHRVRTLWGEDGDDVHYPATIVAFNGKKRKYKLMLHFDDGMDEPVGLPCDTIEVLEERVDACPCAACKDVPARLPFDVSW